MHLLESRENRKTIISIELSIGKSVNVNRDDRLQMEIQSEDSEIKKKDRVLLSFINY